MSQFYTKKGDDGYTGLLGEGRVKKSDPRIEAVGNVDEATSALGVARSNARSELTKNLLLQSQRDLYGLMAEVAATPENAVRFRSIDKNRVEWLEIETNKISELVKIPNEFIIPGDSTSGAYLSLARTIIRRAERGVALLYLQSEIENKEILAYLNRLSSLCFVLELLENQTSGLTETTIAKKR